MKKEITENAILIAAFLQEQKSKTARQQTML